MYFLRQKTHWYRVWWVRHRQCYRISSAVRKIICYQALCRGRAGPGAKLLGPLKITGKLFIECEFPWTLTASSVSLKIRALEVRRFLKIIRLVRLSVRYLNPQLLSLFSGPSKACFPVDGSKLTLIHLLLCESQKVCFIFPKLCFRDWKTEPLCALSFVFLKAKYTQVF